MFAIVMTILQRISGCSKAVNQKEQKKNMVDLKLYFYLSADLVTFSLSSEMAY